ncbi:DUF2845 domain-containing protein [Coralloluteibacterium thermophilus]|uniref:DUF2845 domain-containing protein n=1 Tax=Coralloluteibacterium thermophilum TaxID=2707049 RepID=A0ABV9NJK5_9GAMM
MHGRIPVAVMVVAAALAAPAAAQSLRCGSSVVSAGQDAYEVRRACGEPLSITDRSEVDVRGALGPNETRRERRIEEWIYDRGAGGMIDRLTFENNRLVGVAAVARSSTGTAACSDATFAQGTDEAVLLSRCGAPAQRTPVYEERVARDGARGERYAPVRREEWIYDRGAGTLPRRVLLVDGRIQRADTLGR